MAQDDQNCSKTSQLKTLRESVDWEIEEDRIKFFKNCYTLIENWIDGLPDLRDIFQQDEIELLLMDSIKNCNEVPHKYDGAERLTKFIVSTGYKDVPKLDEEGKPLVVRTTPVHIAVRKNLVYCIPELFKIYDRFDVNFIDESGYTHFHAACQFGCDDVVEKFLGFGQDPNCLVPLTNCSPLYLAVFCKKQSGKKVVESLMRRGADPTLSNAEGSTPLHRICGYHSHVDFLELLFDISEKPLPVNAQDKFGNTPLHVATSRECRQVIEFLLRIGADPSLTNARGVTPLHLICESGKDVDCAKIIIEFNDDIRERLINARDKYGFTPLHAAMRSKSMDLIELLLTKGADPNVANDNGETPLHMVSRYAYLDYVAEMFFKICANKKKSLKIDAKDKLGWTPLHLAIKGGSKSMIELLVARGADPNAVDVEKKTPLHVICSQGDVKKAKHFFRVCDDKKIRVQVDAIDNLGRTPLQYAVSKVKARLVDLILERSGIRQFSGNDPSLVFPTEHEISEQFNDLPDALRVSLCLPLCPPEFLSIWTKASQVVTVVESLLKRGYACDVCQVQSIMKALACHGLLEMSVEPDERSCLLRYLYSSSLFTVTAKKIMIEPCLSLYKLLKLRPEEAKKVLESVHYSNFAESDKLSRLYEEELQDICALLLCEMMMERFFKPLALVPFLSLTHYRLPISYCEIILEKLPNKVLYKLCLLVNGQNLEKICKNTIDDSGVMYVENNVKTK